ncbi:TetR/AcrR family transcriptional regulator; helix-turn-helix transcriptional regulator [Kitasatospora sp. RB6PN24]|uniref:TetR/AcrR family transcriptional regulator n=1 Tax=Kitasatospora humi TaxID=2893891 RepID=UPI001E3C2E1C|nr:TetR/AcrR family transcriptional regulator [Kitasatospora humi]MCC9305558.1 TetR/AcrR family transcriptional regulator; helix-turn-helix transcriptional regulator [Kitasatospora humi]
MSTDQARPLRADAARNRARLLDVAAQVFADRGVSVTTEEIAKAAGVGVGTLFRHFPTKEALLEAVLVRRLETLTSEIGRLTEEQEPAAAFFACFTLMVDQSAGKKEFAQALTAAGVDVHQKLHEPGRLVRARLADLLVGAQRAGAVRADLAVPELLALLVGTAVMVERLGQDQAGRERILSVIFTGLRPAH